MRAGLVAVFAWLLLLPINNLYGSELTDKYFPRKPGMTWTYTLTSDKHPTGKIIVTNLPTKEINDLSVTPRKWESGGTAKYYLVATDDKGVYRYGEQKSESDPPILTKPRVYYIHDPVTNGTTWDINTKIGEDNLTVNLTIENVNDTVKVAAGSFKD
jgi:hypothetical protein